MNLFISQIKDNIKFIIIISIISIITISIALIFYIYLNGLLIKTTSHSYENVLYRIDEVIPMSGTILIFITSIFSFLLGTRVLTLHNGLKSNDLLLSLPISRLNIYINRLLPTLLLILIYYILIFINIVIIMEIFNTEYDYRITALLSVVISIFSFGLLLFSIGLLLSIIFKIYIVNIIGLVYLLLMIIINALAITQNKIILAINTINPIKYIKLQFIVSSQNPDYLILIIYLGISLILMIICCYVYIRKDN